MPDYKQRWLDLKTQVERGAEIEGSHPCHVVYVGAMKEVLRIMNVLEQYE